MDFFQFSQIFEVIYVILFLFKQSIFDALWRYEQGFNIKMILDGRLAECGKVQMDSHMKCQNFVVQVKKKNVMYGNNIVLYLLNISISTLC